MAGPWDNRARQAEPSPTDRLYYAMRRMGMRPVSREDVGEAGIWVGTATTFACSCVRVFRGDVRTRDATEHVNPCDDHKNLLTSLVQQAQDGSTGRQEPAEQERDHDDSTGHR